MHYFYLYSITSPTGKVYIGQTRRWQRRMTHYRTGHCTAQLMISNSIVKHGWENHQVEIISEGIMTQEQIDKLEIETIKRFKNQGISLNIAPGGSKGPCNPPRGAQHFRSHNILQFDLQGNIVKEWASAREATKSLFPPREAVCIYHAFKNNRHYAYGYLWMLKKDYDEGKRPHRDKRRNRCMQEIVQLTFKGEFVAYHTCLADAERAVPSCNGKKPIMIGNCLRKQRNTLSAKGFLWCYKDEYDNGYRPVYYKREKITRSILMYDKQAFVKEFSSMKMACKESGFGHTFIWSQCVGRKTKSSNISFCYKK